jgi:hypothetical protein
MACVSGCPFVVEKDLVANIKFSGPCSRLSASFTQPKNKSPCKACPFLGSVIILFVSSSRRRSPESALTVAPASSH